MKDGESGNCAYPEQPRVPATVIQLSPKRIDVGAIAPENVGQGYG